MISKHVVPGLKWDVRPGTHWCRCFNQSCYGRVLGEDEVTVTHVSEGDGSVHSHGCAKCKVCGAEHRWDTTYHQLSLTGEEIAHE